MKTDSVWNFMKIKFLEKYIAGHNGFVAGGCFKNIFTGEKVKDVDLFFLKAEDHAAAAKWFEENEDYHEYYSNNKVVSYKEKRTGLTIELIKSVFGTPEEILAGFDFTVAKFALYHQADDDEDGTVRYKVLYHDDFFTHLTLKRTVVDDKMVNPASTFERMIRYTKYGFYPCRETKLKIMEAIRTLPGDIELSMSLYDGLD